MTIEEMTKLIAELNTIRESTMNLNVEMENVFLMQKEGFIDGLRRIQCFTYKTYGSCEHHGGKCQDIQALMIALISLPPINEMREDSKRVGRKAGRVEERYRIIDLLIELGAIRRDALGDLVAFNTHGTEVIYLTGLEPNRPQGVISGTSRGSDME